MMKLYLFGLFFLLAAAAFGQQSWVENVQQKLPQIRRAEITKSVPERIFPVSIGGEECADSIALYSFRVESDSGYVFGTNTLLDQAKIQRFVYPGQDRYQITEVGVAFARPDSMIDDLVLSARIYNDINADSTLGRLLATSDSVRIGDVIRPDSLIRFTRFTFPNPPVLDRDSFWVYIDFSDVYEGFGGDIGIYSTLEDCGEGTDVFQVKANGAYTTVENFWGLNAEMFMFTTVDPDVVISTRQPVATYQTTVAPNPTFDQVAISFVPPTSGRYSASLHDLGGRNVRSTASQFYTSDAQINWSLADLPAGLYLYHIDGPQGRQSGKVVKR